MVSLCAGRLNSASNWSEATAGEATSTDGGVVQLDPNAVGDTGGGFGGGPGGGMQRENPLVDRFLANEEWNALYEQAKVDLQAALYGSGTASSILEEWSVIVAESGLVDESTIDSDAAAIESYFA